MIRILALIVVIAASIPSWADIGITVTPVRVELAATDRSEVITILNESNYPRAFEVRVERWTQTAEGEKRETTEEILVTPPITTVAAGASRVLRIFRLGPPPVAQDDAYRIVLVEMSEPPKGDGSKPRFKLQLDLPLFVSAAQTTALAYRFEWGGVEKLFRELKVINTGNHHVHLPSLQVLNRGQPIGDVFSLPGDTLAASSRSYWISLARLAVGDELRVIDQRGRITLLTAPKDQ